MNRYKVTSRFSEMNVETEAAKNSPCYGYACMLYRSLFLIGLTIMTACSGGSGEPVEINDNFTRPDGSSGIVYNGPAAATEDVQNYKSNLWDNLASEDRCGNCHIAGGTSPEFVRRDDINLAYAASNSLIDLEIPANSRIVQKVAGGHNCWSSEASVCAEIMTNYIEAWASASGASSNVIVLTAPEQRDVADSRSFPATAADSNFATTVYPLLAHPDYCASCHAEDAALKQQPFLGSSDIEVAYDAARSKMNLDNPASSRLVTRLGAEFHNCWGDCQSNANEMAEQIAAFAAGIPVTQVDPALLVSRALGLPDGIVASSGGRVENNVIALYEFKSDSTTMAFDTSGVEPALNLNLSGDVSRVGGWGIRIGDGKAQGSTSSSKKLYDLIRATGEYAIEAWVVPDNVTQEGPARIVSFSGGANIRNFTLGQTLYNYNFLNRSSGSDGNGLPMLSTPDAAEVLQATLQHVVANFNPLSGMSLYVNGNLQATNETMTGANLNDWDDTFALVLGNEVDNEYLWQGVIRLLAIHNRSLSAEDIATNYEAGVGEKFYLLFNIGHQIGVGEAYVVFQVEQFDNYSYLFSAPFFKILGNNSLGRRVTLKGMRIGINGREIPVGQSYANLNITIDPASYNRETGLQLSSLGAVVPIDKGPETDQFFLTFDVLGDASYDRVLPTAPPAPVPVDKPNQSRLAVRHFAEINASIAKLTGMSLDAVVDPSRTPQSTVADVYETVKQQLPAEESVDGFLAAHQAGIMQLSVAYCTALVNDSHSRAAMFSGFDFSGPVTTGNVGLILDPLLKNLTAGTVTVDGADVALQTQADVADIRTHITTLLSDMSGADTSTTAIAICAATAGSAVMLLQ